MHYKNRKRDKVGTCRICLATDVDLSWDHVPPKGAIEIQEVEINKISKAFFSSYDQSQPELSQNGLKFRTICESCNSDILGGVYDPAIVQFAKEVARIVRSELCFPRKVHVRARPNAVARAVVGHLMAANITGVDEGFDAALRDSVVNSSADLPADIHVYYWLHPFSHQVVMPNCMLVDISEAERSRIVSILKFFPLGFLVSDERLDDREGIFELTGQRRGAVDFEADLAIEIGRQSRDPFWPERPQGNRALLLGKSAYRSVYAVPRHR